MVARGSIACKDTVRLCSHPIADHHVAIGSSKLKLAVVVVHGERSAGYVEGCESKGDRIL